MKLPKMYTKMAAAVLMVGAVACSSNENKSAEGADQKAAEEAPVPTEAEAKEKLIAEIAEIEQNFFKADPKIRGVYNKQLIQECETYVRLYTSDSLAPDMLFKAGNAAVNALMFEEAEQFYERIVANYHDYKKTPEVLYMQGFVYESHLESFGKAKEKYEAIIQNYPEHELAKQAQMSIDNFGKSDEEIVKSFQDNK